MLNSTTAEFKRAHLAAIKAQVHRKSLGYDVERRFVILRDYACCTSLKFFLQCFECASVFNFDDFRSLEGTFTNLLSIVLPQSNSYCFELLFGVLCSTSLAIPLKRRQESLKFGFICRPQTRYVQLFDEGLDLSFCQPFWGEIYILLYEHFNKWNWHQMYHMGRDELAHARWKSRQLLAVVFPISSPEPMCLLVSTKTQSSGIINFRSQVWPKFGHSNSLRTLRRVVRLYAWPDFYCEQPSMSYVIYSWYFSPNAPLCCHGNLCRILFFTFILHIINHFLDNIVLFTQIDMLTDFCFYLFSFYSMSLALLSMVTSPILIICSPLHFPYMLYAFSISVPLYSYPSTLVLLYKASTLLLLYPQSYTLLRLYGHTPRTLIPL